MNLPREMVSPHAGRLGRCALALGRTGDAAEDLRQARDIFRRIGAAEAADVAAELDSLTRTGQDSPVLEQQTLSSSAMNVAELIATDVHTHAEISASGHPA